ncbi:Peptidase M23 [Desulforamulus ruminis DSM 2154]|uniref:Peptidase M23 n=1 Tax=Desulforamulus ruminis (strain ATCC 23193 / DSM 2154 / NCIMB 8452 / DL) TaxID=696281 RepID=F6DQS4_DESRL|nr:Peptidase M23 [Desulforamulus ruminis DSM 2154]
MQVKEKILLFKTWLDKQPSTYKRVISGALAVFLVLGLLSMVAANRACAIEVDGKVLAVVKDKTTAEAVINSLIKKQQGKAANVKITQEVLCKTVKKDEAEVVSAEKCTEILAKNLSFEAVAVGIKANGGLKVAVKDREAANLVLAKLKQAYQIDPDNTLSFKQKIDLVDLPVKADKIKAVEQAVKYLKGESDKPRYYTVKEGDTLWDIAVRFDVTPEELQAANPDFVPEKMQIDQKIKMVGALDPVIDVVATTQKTIQEDVVLAQQVRKNPSLPYGQSKVIQQGEKGLKEVTYQITAVNGMETERKVLKEKVLKEAKAQIVERSSQTMVASRGLSRPAGAILSPFGMRSGRMHTGIDLARGYGSPIQAAQSGKVIRAGWYGGYGNCVDISHGNGLVTRYGHMSSISVKVGQTVQKGSIIGKVGSTGRSTGPHLHFEVIVNGVPRNPLSYL